MEQRTPVSVGLGGDGDELAAIDEVEMTFGVTLDYADAAGWHRAGDVFASLLRQLPRAAQDDPDTWRRFAVALTDGTGVDATAITPDSPLIDTAQPWQGLGRMSAMLWVLLIAALVLVVTVALFAA